MDFRGFKKIIFAYRNKEIDRKAFCELWLAEQERLGVAR